MIQFYSPDIAAGRSLPPEESAHAVRVLRMKAGDPLVAVDGKGSRFHCVVTKAAASGVEVEILNQEEVELPWSGRIVLAVAPTKNSDRIEWLVEKCVEMGIDEIVLLECAHSERRRMNTGRLERIMVSAMKQSLKATLPKLRGPVAYTDFLAEAGEGEKFIAWCGDGAEKKSFSAQHRGGEDVTVLIGPEGDFSPAEVEEALRKGFVPVSLGESRLRTETAAMFAVAAVHAVNQTCEN